MVQRGKRLRLALESSQALNIRGDGRGQDFDRDLASEIGIGGAVDLTHPPGAQRTGHLVRSYSCAGFQRHRDERDSIARGPEGDRAVHVAPDSKGRTLRDGLGQA